MQSFITSYLKCFDNLQGYFLNFRSFLCITQPPLNLPAETYFNWGIQCKNDINTVSVSRTLWETHRVSLLIFSPPDNLELDRLLTVIYGFVHGQFFIGQ